MRGVLGNAAVSATGVAVGGLRDEGSHGSGGRLQTIHRHPSPYHFAIYLPPRQPVTFSSYFRPIFKVFFNIH